MERKRERERGGRGKGVGWLGEEREQVFTQADQEYSAYMEDESGGKGLLADKLRWLCFISQG